MSDVVIVAVVRVRVDERDPDTTRSVAESLVRHKLDQPIAGPAEVTEFRFVVTELAHED